MSQGTFHTPVMVAEVVELVRPVPPGLVVDATIGGAGHAAAILESRSDVVVVGIDRDGDAVAEAAARLVRFGRRARVRRARFDALAEVLAAAAPTELARSGGVSAVLFDLGVSSHQLDCAERGFSYRRESPLDMRMDRATPRNARDLVNTLGEDELARLFAAHGEARFAPRIARAIVRERPIVTTTALADLVARAVPPAARRRGHPAGRVFQALRVAVNEELDVLPRALDQALALLVTGGRIVALAYHSGEDRVVKERFRTWSTGGCTCPPGLACVCGARSEVRLLNRGARRPSGDEVARNPRAVAARLRAVERLPADDGKAGDR
ncbi:MAG TPA: 16S rRNA (cytosine(1402)-N(4))-methyltransferase RsmH [Acidimicrobiales bacterium]|nr:16S rRNA (cytosine(1402)-N(4))-methyltransferase RsmH [Acidimicrobiales bacterium]